MAQEILSTGEFSDDQAPPASGAEAAARPAYTGWVLFAISSPNLNIELVTQSLGVTPDRVVQPLGDRDGVWQINSRLDADARMEAHLWDILQRLVPAHQQLRRIAPDVHLEFYCAVEKEPGAVIQFDLPPRLMLLVGHLGAHVVWDVSERHVDAPGGQKSDL